MSYVNMNYFSKAVKIIYAQIDQPFSLDELALKLGLSLSSLKRLFREAVGQSPGEFIRHFRMELAFCSLQSKEASILEVALGAGFEDQSAFARGFKKIFGYPPKRAREILNIVSELECIRLQEPDMVELDAIQLQAVTATGLYFSSAPRAWENLQSKLTESELAEDFMGLFIGIGHDNPHDGTVREDQVRFSAGVSHLNRDIKANSLSLKQGLYARFYYWGKPNNLGLAYHYIFGQWLENTSYRIDKERLTFNLFTSLPDAFTEQKILIHVPCLEFNKTE